VTRRHTRGDPERVGALVPRVLRDLGLEASARVVYIAERWEQWVGADVARRCRPTALRGDVLELEVESSAWCQALQLRRPELLAALRRELGERAPRELWLRVGPGLHCAP
jgi:predicted nucleic acid-binding Zn ribbon protein